ncbi:MAG: 2-oxoglutarate dehydrogenase complex dihydrolipoyllysine-residue succinyltransferase [Planctomycetota bacterium]
MATDIVIPDVGESVTEGVIASWTVAEGDYVERDATVLELETDKITMEVPAPAAGVLVKQSAGEGDTVEVGAVVGSIDESADKLAGGGGSSEASKSEGGDDSSKSQAATAVAEKPKAESKPPTASNGAASKPVASSGGSGDQNLTPLAKKLAAENNVDLSGVTGTGAGGRIREQDVLAAMQTKNGTPSARSAGTPAASPTLGGSRDIRVEKMSPMRQRIASRLVEAQQTAAMLTTFNEVDMGPVMELRKKHKEAFGEKHGIGLGFMSFFVKACCSALKTYPAVNSFIVEGDDGKPAQQHHDYCDVAIAVSSPKGLVVPVLRNAETMSFAGIESTIKDFAVRAKDGKLGLDEMQGGTFTITNGGIFGSLMSTPILNPPQSGILGMHGIKKRAMEYPEGSGEIKLRPMMYLALSYDHRVVDGAGAVQFLVHIKNAIEDPARLMLEL